MIIYSLRLTNVYTGLIMISGHTFELPEIELLIKQVVALTWSFNKFVSSYMHLVKNDWRKYLLPHKPAVLCSWQPRLGPIRSVYTVAALKESAVTKKHSTHRVMPLM